MNKFIIGTFLILGFGFYELSGGSDFEPDTRPLEQAVVSTKSLELVPFDEPVVTRAAVKPSIAPIQEVAVIAASLEVAPTVEAIAEITVGLDLRSVSGIRVNMRSGPGTGYGVVDTLPRGTETEVVEVNADGWARIRVISTDQSGWMSAQFLTES